MDDLIRPASDYPDDLDEFLERCRRAVEEVDAAYASLHEG
jgi:hypothetical protein